MADIAAALTQSLAKDGQTAPTASLPMAGFKHTNVGKATAANEYARADQVQDGSLLRCSGEANTGDAYIGVLPFSATAFVNGQTIVFKFPAANTTTAPTLNINSSAAWPILRQDGSVVQPGDCVSGVPSYLTWNDTAWLLLGVRPASATVAGVSSFNTRTGAVTLISADIGTALGYTAANKAGDTFTGPVILAGDAATALGAVTLQQMLAQIASIPPITGPLRLNDGTAAAPAYSFSGESNIGIYRDRANVVAGAVNGTPVWAMFPGAFALVSTAYYGWCASGLVTIDTSIRRNAPGVVEINGLPGTPGDLLARNISATGLINVVGPITGNDASFKRSLSTAVVQAPSATLNFSVNDTLTVTLTGNQTITAISGLATEGNEGVVIVKNTGAGTITWPTTHWQSGVPPNLASGTEKIALVYLRRIGTDYYARAFVF
jgi:hypothetical protein